MFARYILALVVVVAMVASCKQTDFAGSGGIQPAKKTETQTETPPGDVSEPLGSGSEGIEDPIDDGTVALDEPIDGGDDDTDVDTDIDTGSDGDDDTPWLDIIGGLIDTLKDVDIDEDDDGITFGGRKKFHIGDGQAANSSCQLGLATHPLSGTKFYFEFEVKEDNTTVDIEVESICGVDYGDSNFVYVESLNGGQKWGEKTLPIGADDIGIDTLTLNRGHYAVAVESKISQSSGGGTDADDYVVGKVRIRGDKPMKAGKVGAR